MNANRFRLVFSKKSGMYVPTSEVVSSQGKDGGHVPRAALALSLLFAALPTMAELPNPCGGGACGVNPNPTAFVTSGAASYAVNGAQGVVTQTSNKAILNWQSFNIGQGHSLEFKQPGADAASLNRIWQADPSVIAGALKANGQVYLINQQGIVFANGAQVNVGGLIASSLNITDSIFQNGLLSPSQGSLSKNVEPNAALSAFADGSTGNIEIELGALIETTEGGRVQLYAPTVNNAGRIATPDGQVILGAGKKVFLKQSDDPALRGLLVEVGEGGTVSNQGSGVIASERGNVTLIGLAVNQDGRITATTSARATGNGTIRLLARDTPRTPSSGANITAADYAATRAGTVKLGENSVTEVLPELDSDVTEAENENFVGSRIDVVGQSIHHAGRIAAAGGTVALSAVTQDVNGFLDTGFNTTTRDTAARIYLTADSVIDVSGADIELAMATRQLTVDLRSDELKDLPFQRDGVLKGKTVTVDASKGALVANVSNYIAGLTKTVGEKTLRGGTVKLKSAGDVVVAKGATIDVSGGSIRYLEGALSLTQLVSGGKLYDITTAPADRIYEAVIDGQPQFVAGFTEGHDAGSIEVKGHGLVLDGNLQGQVEIGPYQRDTPPAGGLLVLEDFADSVNGNIGNLLDGDNSHDVLFSAIDHDAGIGAADPVHGALGLDTDFITRGGFSRISLTRHGTINVAADLNLAAGGSINLTGRSVDVTAAISVPAGDINLNTVLVKNEASPDLLLRPGSRLSTSGLWINDRPDIAGSNSGVTLVNAGDITLQSAGNLILGELVDGALDPAGLALAGGAWYSSGGKLVKGNGGNLTLKQNGTLLLGAVIDAISPGTGGKLSFGTQGSMSVQTGELAHHDDGLALTYSHLADYASDQMILPTALFSELGFGSYSISQQSLRVEPGAQVNVLSPYLELSAGSYFSPSAASLSGLATPASDPLLRKAASLTFNQDSAIPGSEFLIGAGASIRTDAGGTINLTSNSANPMVIDGDLYAPAGSISLVLNKNPLVNALVADLGIWLGSTSSLSTAGVYVTKPRADGLRQGDVLNGGKITLSSDLGFIVAKSGSLLDISGTQAVLDLTAAGGIDTRSVYSHGGSLSLSASLGLFLDGQIKAQGGGTGARGGSLTMAMTSPNQGVGSFYPTNERVISVLDSATASAPSDLTAPGDELAAADQGVGLFNLRSLRGSGIEQLSLRAGNFLHGEEGAQQLSLGKIRFENTIDLTRETQFSLSSLTLDAPLLDTGGHQVVLNADYLALRNSDSGMSESNSNKAEGQPLNVIKMPEASGGNGGLTLSAGLIDLSGMVAVRNADSVTLDSAGDIRAQGLFYANRTYLTESGALAPLQELYGRFAVAKNLTLNAAQVYPATFTQFELESQAVDGMITVAPGARAAAPILSAGGDLTLRAASIEVLNGAALKAPLGRLNLESSTADGKVHLATGSLLSTSAEGAIIPFGYTENGIDWVYEFSPGNFKLVQAEDLAKLVDISADTVAIDAGATLDISGGGDAYAYEFIPGPGGSSDQLSAAAQLAAGNKTPTRFAILPWLGENAAPRDTVFGQGYDIAAGEAVYLEGGAGLAAGYYQLLPAHYALLPGAFLIETKAGFTDLASSQGQALSDGTPVSSGYRTNLLSGVKDARWSGFAVYNHEQAKQFSEYRHSFANDFFTAAAADTSVSVPRLPEDAGRLAVTARVDMLLAGDLVTEHAVGSRGAEVDLIAPKLAVLAPGGSLAGHVVLTTDVLNRLNAESLLLGGKRLDVDGSQHIETDTTTHVVIGNDAANVFTAPEVLVAARDEILVRSNSVIEASGAPSDAGLALEISGDGAFLAVSGRSPAFSRVDVERTRGNLVVEANTTLRSGGGIVLDATLENRFAGAIEFTGATAGLTLGASRISFGEVPVGTEGLVFEGGDLGLFAAASAIELKSYSSIDFYGSLTLGELDSAGAPNIESLTFASANLQGHGAATDTVSVNAAEITLANPDAVLVAAAGSGAGHLALNSKRLVVGEGDKSVSGFASIAATAEDEIVGVSTGASSFSGGVTLKTARITGKAKSNQSLSASGDLNIESLTRPANAAVLAAVSDLGAKWRFAGASLSHQGVIELPAGVVMLHAGTGDASVTGMIDVSGRLVDFSRPDQGLVAKTYAPGGTIGVESVAGDIAIAAGARLDVSGVVGGNAGTLELAAANGSVNIADATLFGNAVAVAGGETVSGGNFRLDVAALPDYQALNRKLIAGGFDATQQLRVRGGDVTIPATEKRDFAIKASDYRLSVDAGKISIAGTIDASGDRGGHIGLFAGNGLLLESGANLNAAATAADKRGGRVELYAGNGMLDLRAGSKIAVDAGANGQAGAVLLRSLRNSGNVNVTALDSSISGAGEVVLEAVQVYASISSLGSAEFEAFHSDSSTFMVNAVAIESALGKAGDPSFHLRPGVEAVASGDLTLAEDWNLLAARYDTEPGILTLRSSGDLLIEASLSDGFSTAATNGTLQSGDSWSYRLVAGADSASANPLDVRHGQGDVIVSADKVVRTGTGDIAVAAGRNIELACSNCDKTSFTSGVIYTAGAPSVWPTGVLKVSNSTLAGLSFPEGGGDVSLTAGEDIIGAGTPQLVASWLRRKVNSGTARELAWGIDFSKFKQDVAALGGGDVTVSSGGDIRNLSVSLPSTGQVPGTAGQPFQAAAMRILGGGDMRVTAGGDVLSGLYYVSNGAGVLQAGGNIASGRLVSDTSSNASIAAKNNPIYTLLVTDNARMTVSAGGDLHLGSVANSTMLPVDNVQLSSDKKIYFYTLGERAGLDLFSRGGDVTLHNNEKDILEAARNVLASSPDIGAYTNSINSAYPSGLNVVATQGDILIANPISLFPSPYGHLHLLARDSIELARLDVGNQLRILDSDPGLFKSPINPVANGSPALATLNLLHASSPIHWQGDGVVGNGVADADSSPLTMVALNGDILGNASLKGEIESATGFMLYAGRDIENLKIRGQHVQSLFDETSSVVAGRDIRYTTPRDIAGKVSGNAAGISLGGDGSLEVFAGRHIDLGSSNGIVTDGDLGNTNLTSAAGAAVRVMSGLSGGVDYAGFTTSYFDPAKSVANEAGYVASMLAYYQKVTGDSNLTAAAAFAMMQEDSDLNRRVLVLDALFNEVRESGRAAAVLGGDEREAAYQRGFAAVASLFPGDTQAGDLSLLFSQINTEAGGGIDILVPGGKVNAGQTTASSGISKDPADLGIMAFDLGAIRAIVDGRGPADDRIKGDFAVNESRVFTLRGGDILLWSNDGDLDAGRGAKSTVSAPPPQLVFDNSGNLKLKVVAVAGSGIRALLTDPTIDPASVDVDLFAPRGSINAGDAGIASAGNVTLAAVQVIGADNIQAGGVSTGVPISDAGLSGVSAISGVSDVASTAQEATKSLGESTQKNEQAAQEMKQALANFKPSFISVEVIGFGNTSAPGAKGQDDEEIKRRAAKSRG